MENLNIQGSHGTYFVPSVKFNARTGICELAGESYLEETIKFYDKLLRWIDQYIKDTGSPITFNIKLTYFNTSSSRAILDILVMLRNYEENGGKVVINWFYDEKDIDMQEEIEDYMLESEMDINMIPVAISDDEENIED